MDENPYAPPAEPAEKSRDERKYERGLWHTARGLAWLFCSCIVMMALLLMALLDLFGFYMNGMPGYPVPLVGFMPLAAILVSAASISLLFMLPMGAVACCFCPKRLVKGGRFLIIGSMVVMSAVVVILFYGANASYAASYDMEVVMRNLFLLGVAVSIQIWLVFTLRLARALESTRSVWLVWGNMFIYGVVVAGVLLIANVDLYHHTWWDYPMWVIQETLLTTWMFAAMVCVGVHAVMLEMLRRRIRRMLAESL